jgi:hypothetical protein
MLSLFCSSTLCPDPYTYANYCLPGCLPLNVLQAHQLQCELNGMGYFYPFRTTFPTVFVFQLMTPPFMTSSKLETVHSSLTFFLSSTPHLINCSTLLHFRDEFPSYCHLCNLICTTVKAFSPFLAAFYSPSGLLCGQRVNMLISELKTCTFLIQSFSTRFRKRILS